TVKCTLVDNLPDIHTESDQPVDLPAFLLDKWEKEGRKAQELKELDQFFDSTGYPRAARFYIIKWLVDYIRELGIDGFRVDTAKHTEAGVWSELYAEAVKAFEAWKKENPDKKLDDNNFYMVGEVYNYSIYNGLEYPYEGDTAVNFFAQGFKSLINFSLKWEAEKKPMDEIFSTYASILNGGDLKGKTVLHYLSSHDDHDPFDKNREKPFATANYLMLAPGTPQIYYGDETARLLHAEGAKGDANLRTFMNWEELEGNIERNGHRIDEIRNHWARLGLFRRDHPAVGAGKHEKINEEPYTFKRTYQQDGYSDAVVVVMGNARESALSGAFEEGTLVTNYYTGEQAEVKEGKVSFDEPSRLLLIGVKPKDLAN
ncbi:MAG: alpha-amylase family glycosyl hydrolase, partial [Fulvivirga sp.]|nr:alpha-amylase family glycosyl hydrolase [Fulvivirga sp.]